MKIRLAGAELFHTNGRTDRHDETNGYICQFCERALKTNFYCILQSSAKCFDPRAIFTGFSNTDD
jgi:hypothetical protein